MTNIAHPQVPQGLRPIEISTDELLYLNAHHHIRGKLPSWITKTHKVVSMVLGPGGIVLGLVGIFSSQNTWATPLGAIAVTLSGIYLTAAPKLLDTIKTCTSISFDNVYEDAKKLKEDLDMAVIHWDALPSNKKKLLEQRLEKLGAVLTCFLAPGVNSSNSMSAVHISNMLHASIDPSLACSINAFYSLYPLLSLIYFNMGEFTLQPQVLAISMNNLLDSPCPP
jgi:hypothetical protein